MTIDQRSGVMGQRRRSKNVVIHRSMATQDSLSQLSDTELLDEVKRLVAIEREATADVIRSLCEVEVRQLHLSIGYPSMFAYCTNVLHLSEHAAYARIAAARAARRFPLVMELLVEGSITLTTVTLLARHLTEENHRELLENARQKSKHEVEVIVATVQPRPDVPSSVRKLPEPRAVSARPAVRVNDASTFDPLPEALKPQLAITPPTPRAMVAPIAPERYRLQVTIGAETRDKLRRAQDLLWHTNPSGDEAVIIDRALTVLVELLEKAKFAQTDKPRRTAAFDETSRRIPAAVRRTVSRRDGFRCAYVGRHGRCTETGGLEYHHRIAFADGGLTTVDNLELRCRAHNAYEADRWFGTMFTRERANNWWQGSLSAPLAKSFSALAAGAHSRS